ncbi:Hsp20/alpha crystallin family protein [Synechocystis sp. PCC 7339]|uniref:Hsp20/alpha crystallin family protein n=1 Tax=unclassified Synechocystis TaxID=2640012 RepID=UPI001BAFFA14|nr:MULTISPECIES: Hsp20/alpha crystallin family protein [unclassified Synechocystis]QUS60525.1 Hsp20/alpha crystallin family protein [Synechocystis sp. PCC 7338]UAJ72023.1 Hsp20/alpha crystallin family protein [Synechocystis sp. PCC 7339]
MSLILYNPLREMDSFQKQMNQLFDEVFVPSERQGFNPKAELTETEEAYVLKLELPGISPDNLDIQATRDAVTVSGDRQDTHSTEKDGVRRTEFRYGSFHRVIPVPGAIQNSEVKANYDAGILTLTLPKVEEAKNKVVKVQLC